jgi:ELWxxDGT repeat protein
LTEGTSATTRQATSAETSYCHGGHAIEPMGNLFVTLGCSPTLLVIDPASNLFASHPAGNCYQNAGFGVLGGTAAAAFTCFGGNEIWRSDGTSLGTHLAMTLPEGFSVFSAFFPVNGRLLFHGGTGGSRLHALSAAMTSVLPISSDGVYPESGIAPQGEPLGFFSQESRIWRTDGTAAGTFAVGPAYDWLNLSGAVRSEAGYDLVVHNSSSETEIWSTDGTALGTVVRARLAPHYISWAQVPVERAGQRLYFLLDRYPDGMALWVLEDGATEPAIVHSASPNYLASRALAHHGDRVFFAACDGSHGCELWVSDGTASGTRMLHDISPGPASSGPSELLVAGDKLYFTANDGQHGSELWLLPLDGGAPCRANERHLCLEDSRFQVSAHWRDFSGRTGDAKAVAITGDTGYFWFFDEDNVELVLKLIDGGGFNGHHWVYYGALSNIEYTFTVTDSVTGAAKRYFNPATRFASSGDITAFGPQGAHATGGVAEEWTRAGSPPSVSPGAFSAPQGLPGACVPTATRFCILGNRFAVSATWRDFAGNTGVANVGTLTDDTGYFWFFDDANVEVVLKMVDAGSFNHHFWVYYGALSNVEYTITVTDTVAGGPPRVYRNDLGKFGSFGDIAAFPAP